jgi:hypothetical protein
MSHQTKEQQMKKQTAAKALRIAHLASAITIGFCVSGMDVAPMRVLFWTTMAGMALTLSYYHIYYVRNDRKWKPFSDTPIDDEVRRDLGIKD